MLDNSFIFAIISIHPSLQQISADNLLEIGHIFHSLTYGTALASGCGLAYKFQSHKGSWR